MVNSAGDMSGDWTEARVYESGSWNQFDMTFDDCIEPAGIVTIGNNFYYLYGDGTTEDQTVYLPTTMNGAMFTK